MEIFGLIACLFIGISLGLIGGGGSILTVPVLVYIFKVDAVLATSYSLFIVGISSIVGSFSAYRNKLIDFKTALIFGTPSIVVVFLTRKFLIPLIPDTIIQLNQLIITKQIFLLIIFALLMVVASYNMIKSKSVEEVNNNQISYNYPLILIEGVVVGLFTGLVGAGGGFLIIPALVLLTKLPMKKAVGTSLLIIATKSLIGFVGDLSHLEIDWIFLLKISSLAIVGIFIGTHYNKKVDAQKLKVGFGWFVLAMGIYILIKELLLK